VFTALLRLRQMACDPRLVDPTLEHGGSKRDVFLNRVRAVVEGGRRALVFSQFVELLSLWRRDLDREGIAYEYLDGATVDRAEVVRRFQEGDAPLFLISLKAGGTGLTLTAADTVILCDPWWNPAVEAQAGDRAHRIGQTRAVTVYRLICKGTVEERVMALKDRKRRLAESLLEGLDAPAPTLDDDTLRALFADAEGAP
jgi:SNF2 family DNA or RNA helicase